MEIERSNNSLHEKIKDRMAAVASSSSVASSRGGSTVGEGTYEGTFEGSNSLTSSIQMRGEEASTLDESGTNSLTSSVQMRSAGEEGSTSSESSSYARELSLPSSFASEASSASRRGVVRLGPIEDNDGNNEGSRDDGRGSPVESGFYNASPSRSRSGGGSSRRSQNSNSFNQSSGSSRGSSRPNPRENKDGDDHSGRMEVYSASEGSVQVLDQANNSVVTTEEDASSMNTEDRLELRISKETKPMMHLLRMLKEIEDEKAKNNGGSTNSGDPKSKAVASLISDFEKEVTLIEHRIKDESLIMNGEQPPLPPNWIALEDPDSGDIYYANEATGDTQWERPGLMNDLKQRVDDMNMNNSSLSNNFQNSNMSNKNMQGSNMSNNHEGSAMHNSNTSINSSSTSNNNSNLNNSRNSFEGSNASNNFDGGMTNSGMSNNYDNGENMRNSNMSNNYDNGDMRNSGISNHYDSPGNNNFADQSSGMQNSGNRDMNTLESSLTDSNNHGEDVLPPEWIVLEDPDTGETYYANEVTGESSWEKPTMPQSMPEKNNDNGNGGADNDEDLPPDWIALEDADSGDTYYLNQVTMEATWDKPNSSEKDLSNNIPETDDTSQQPSEAASDNGDLPPGWEAILEPSSGDYYYAHESGETQWEKPPFSSQQQSDIVPPEDDFSNQQGPPENGKDDNNDLQDDDNNGLPPGWFAAVDEGSGDTYYCNEATGETTWDVPTEPAIEENQNASPGNNPNQAPTSDDDLPPGWFAVADPSSGDDYFVHEESGETTWDRPTSGMNGPGGRDADEQDLMKRTSFNEASVYEDDSVTSSQY